MLDPTRLAISTCWCSSRHVDGYDMLYELRELGFSQVELSHGIRVSLVPGILRALAEKVVTVSSVHNFWPLPSSVQHAAPNLFQPSARSRQERELWLHYSRQTLEFAEQVGAPVVVMHSGSVSFRFRSPASVLGESGGGEGDRRYRASLQRLRSAARRALPRVVKSYRDLALFAEEKGIRLGAENREGTLELPLDAGWTDFLSGFEKGGPVGYWHDTGHAEIKHQQGLLDPARHLELVAERLLGFHLHDVSAEGRDHQVPGSGSVDFSLVRQFIRPEHVLVLEPSPRLTSEDIRVSRAFLLDQLGA